MHRYRQRNRKLQKRIDRIKLVNESRRGNRRKMGVKISTERIEKQIDRLNVSTVRRVEIIHRDRDKLGNQL